MSDHLRFAGADAEVQRQALIDIIADDPLLMRLLQGMVELELPDPLVGSGAIYNVVWNVLTGRERHRGIKDADLVYFDPHDLSYDAEDQVIRRAEAQFAGNAIPVEVRNQARVHLWFPKKFGLAYPELTCSADMLLYFATRTHAVAARIENGKIVVFAPFGLDDMFSFRLTPNPALANRATHERKAARAMQLWPELQFEPWPDPIGD
ncbi:MAG: nucleotidyltransferase family protein [Devosia sp.]